MKILLKVSQTLSTYKRTELLRDECSSSFLFSKKPVKFFSHLLKCTTYQTNERLSVAVVCPGSMATGKYLEVQIRNYFDFKIIGVIAASEVCQKLKEVKNVDWKTGMQMAAKTIRRSRIYRTRTYRNIHRACGRIWRL